MTHRILAAAFAATLVAACGGGGGTALKGLSENELDRLRSDPRVVRLGPIVEHADTLLLPSLRLHLALRAQGQSISESEVERYRCTGARCSGDSGGEITITDLVYPSGDSVTQGVSLETIGGFDTAQVKGQMNLSSALEGSGVSVSSLPSTNSWGYWGDHGYGAVAIVDGALSGRYRGVEFSGSLRAATALILGDASGSNPRGLGSATWRGIAEAVSVNSYRRHQGTATVSIPDLSRDSVDVDVRIAGRSIGSSNWSGMSLRDGGYGAGYVGRDYIKGQFHGADHSETYGVFDTGVWLGAFGAKRQQ